MSEWGWRNRALANFYLAPTRAWELFSGSVTAFVVQQYGVRKNNILASLGLAAVIFSIFAYDYSTPFPSLYTLVPVSGVVLLILFAGKETIVKKLLSVRAFVGIGLISYSAYLWHQPLFAFTKIYTKELDLSFELNLLLIICTLALSLLSWKFIETPFRINNVISRRLFFWVAFVSMVLLVLFGVASKIVQKDSEYRLAQLLSENEYIYFQNMDERKFVEGRLLPLRTQILSLLVQVGCRSALKLLENL